MHPDEKFLTVEELADLLKVSKKTIYRLTACKEIPFYRVGSGKKGIRFNLDEILEWLEEHREIPMKEPPDINF